MSEEFPIRLAGQIFSNKKYLCSLCGMEVKGFNDRKSAEEFRITGTCQICQDIIFSDSEEQNENTG